MDAAFAVIQRARDMRPRRRELTAEPDIEQRSEQALTEARELLQGLDAETETHSFPCRKLSWLNQPTMSSPIGSKPRPCVGRQELRAAEPWNIGPSAVQGARSLRD